MIVFIKILMLRQSFSSQISKSKSFETPIFEEIKKINTDAKVIMVTAAGQQNKMVEAIKSGASEFVTKPFEADEITGLIAKM